MILHRTSSAAVASIEAPLLTVTGPNSEGMTFFLENLDTVNYCQYRTQVANSPDDASYTDLVADATNGAVVGNFGVSGILTPQSAGSNSNRVMISVRTSAPYTRILISSSGGAQINYGVTMQTSSGPNNFTLGTL
jgi:hypothetical protein